MTATSRPAAAIDVGSEAVSRYLRVLGDPTRLEIIRALLERDHTVSELVDALEAPQSRISNHLACLRWCRVVDSKRFGRTVVYRVTDARVARIIELAAALTEPNCDYLASCTRIGPDWV